MTLTTSQVNSIDPAPLFRYLDERGIQQLWLADQLGISKGHLTNIKAGRKPVPDWMPAQVSRVLDVPSSALFHNLPGPDTTPELDAEVA